MKQELAVRYSLRVIACKEAEEQIRVAGRSAGSSTSPSRRKIPGAPGTIELCWKFYEKHALARAAGLRIAGVPGVQFVGFRKATMAFETEDLTEIGASAIQANA